MDNRQIQQALEVALAAAEAGAGELMAGYGHQPQVRYKGVGAIEAPARPHSIGHRRNCGGPLPRLGQGAVNLVTDYDLRSEELVRKIISKAYPDHLLVGEEKGDSGYGQSDYRWYIDPLDGTANFVRGHPFFAVSIGLIGPGRDGRERPLVGVIKAPALGELYWGRHGGGAYRRLHINGRGLVERRLAVTQTAQLREAVLNTGFPYDIYERGGEILHPFGRLVMAARSIRRAGSAALNVAYVAAGMADAFWETGLKPWDVAAGLLLLAEAGGKVSDYSGEPYVLGSSRDILGSNSVLHDMILDYLRP